MIIGCSQADLSVKPASSQLNSEVPRDPACGEGIGLLEIGLGCTCPGRWAVTGFRLAPVTTEGIPMKR